LASGCILDLGCGTGAAGASWAIASGSSTSVIGVDKHPWAVSEARWTYAQLGVNGVAKHGDIDRQPVMRRGESVIAAYTLNELSDAGRDRVEKKLVQRSQQGGRILVVEPLARGVAPWWPRMAERFNALGGRADEWKVSVDVPPIVRLLGTAAGLDYRQLRFQTLLL
jgi:SAM-dependent methyltransferase